MSANDAIEQILRRAGIAPDPHYCQPWQVALRKAPGGSVCCDPDCDPDCDLSGDYAHTGPCEPCSCGKEHAIEECPATVVLAACRESVGRAVDLDEPFPGDSLAKTDAECGAEQVLGVDLPEELQMTWTTPGELVGLFEKVRAR